MSTIENKIEFLPWVTGVCNGKCFACILFYSGWFLCDMISNDTSFLNKIVLNEINHPSGKQYLAQ